MKSLFEFVLSHESVGEYLLEYSPTGWENMELAISRDKVAHGMTSKYILDFNFVKDGYAFIRTVVNTFGYEADIYLTLYELNANTNKHFPSYQGRFNLYSYTATEIDCSVDAENTDFGLKLLNLDDVSIELTKLVALDGSAITPFTNELTNVGLHSKAILKTYEASSDENQPEFNYRPVTREEETSGTLYLGFDNNIKNDFNAYTYGTGLNFSKDVSPLIEFTESGPITIEYELDFHIECRKNNGFFKIGEVDFFFGTSLSEPPVNDIGPTPPRIHSWNDEGLSSFLSHDVKTSGSVVINVKPGDKLYFYGYAGVFDTSGKLDFEWLMWLNGVNRIKVSGVTATSDSTASGMLVHEAGARLIQSLTGREDAFYSEILGRTDSEPRAYAKDGELSFLWLTNGSLLRGFSVAERPLYAVLKEFTASLNAIRPIGYCTEIGEDGTERFRLEGAEHFYQKDNIVLRLGIVDKLTVSVAKEYIYNQVEFGFEKWGSDDDNSLDEVATKQTRQLPITEKNKYSILSKYPGAGYLLEEVRRLQYAIKPEKEDSDDKTNFWVCVLNKSVGNLRYYIAESNENLIVCNNVLSPSTIYNARIWPFRNFLRHGAFIRAGLRFQEKKEIAFGEGNANYLAETQFKDEKAPIIENQTVLVSDLAEPLFIPEYYSFTSPLRPEERILIEQNPYGVITFMDKLGGIKGGFIIDVNAKIYDREADFKLLRINL